MLLIKYPDPILSTPCEEVSPEDFKSGRLLDICMEMVKLMNANAGVGLAAPQVGINKQICVCKLKEGLNFFFNPQILWRGVDVITHKQGCLSDIDPTTLYKTSRHNKIRVKYQDYKGTFFIQEFRGIDSFILQHEIDHCLGKVVMEDEVDK